LAPWRNARIEFGIVTVHACSMNGRVIYFENWVHPAAVERIARIPAIDARRLAFDDPPGRLEEELRSAHVYQIRSTRSELPDEYFAHQRFLLRCPQLLAVSTTGSGYDTVDLDACTEAGVIVVNQAGANKEGVAEHVLGMMLCLSKRIVEADRAVRSVAGLKRDSLIGHDILGKTIGIIGLGNIGTRVAELAGSLFRMRVIASDPNLTPAEFDARGAERVDLKTLLRESDFVTVHCPRLRSTEGLIGRDEFAAMAAHAYFITTARGGITDEGALSYALQNGHIAGAGVDVWEDEPPSLDHPLLRFDNVVVTPHTAGVTHESRCNMALGTVEQIVTILSGNRPPRLLNPDAWDAFRARHASI